MTTPGWIAVALLLLVAGGAVGVAALFYRRLGAMTAEARSAHREREAAEGERLRAVAGLEPARERLAQLEAKSDSLADQLGDANTDLASVRAERRAAEDKHAELVESLKREHATELRQLKERLKEQAEYMAEADKRFEAAFQKTSAEQLRQSQEQLLKMASERIGALNKQTEADLEKRRAAVDELIKPIGKSLEQTHSKLEEIEKTRLAHTARMQEQLLAMTDASVGLRDETARLTRALSRPEIRGQYGEIQLRRVAELAGMTDYCDFTEQESVRDADGALLRPDMVVRLPNERVIAVDAKTNTYAYLEAANAKDDAERETHLERFARHVSDQARKLADKKYWAHFDHSPEFVVMFIPGDHFIDAALSRKPDLLDVAAQQRVILASPSTLIGLLRAVAVGWHEHRLADEARELLNMGRELHDRARTMFEHVDRLGASLSKANEHYNKLVGSAETRLLPHLRKFEELGVNSAGKTVPELPTVELMPRSTDRLPMPEPKNDGD